MKPRKVPARPERLANLLEDLRRMRASPEGDHLTADEADGYASGELAGDALARVEAHLASCPSCAENLERLCDGLEAWRGPAGARRLAAVRARVQRVPSPAPPLALPALEPLKGWLQQATASLAALLSGPSPAWSGSTPAGPEEIWRWQNPEGSLRATGVREPNGDLTVRVAALDLAWEGTRLVLRVGALEHGAVLERVSAHELLAKIRLPRQELPASTCDISLGLGGEGTSS